MNAVQSASQTHRLSAVSVACEGIPGADNVTGATKNVFESIKEWVVLFWTSLVTWIKNTWNATTFLFFRVVGWISPEWSAKMETWCLYGMNFWQNYTAQNREAALQGEIETLRRARAAIENAARDAAGERDRLREEIDRLRCEHEMLILDNGHLRETNASLLASQTHLAGERNAARQSEGLVLGQVGHMRDRIEPLESQIRSLQAERVALLRQVDVLMQGRLVAQEQPSHGLGAPYQFAQILSALPPSEAAQFARLMQPPGSGGVVYVA